METVETVLPKKTKNTALHGPCTDVQNLKFSPNSVFILDIRARNLALGGKIDAVMQGGLARMYRILLFTSGLPWFN